MYVLFNDFGIGSLYANQLELSLRAVDNHRPVVTLMSDAPAFRIRAAAILLRSLYRVIPQGAVVLAVVDPGVGTSRGILAIEHSGGWLLAPDNGLAAIAAREFKGLTPWRLDMRQFPDASASFHGRDVFVPAALMLARGAGVPGSRIYVEELLGWRGPSEMAEVIYVDPFGNLFSGVRAACFAGSGKVSLTIAGREIPFVRTFGDVDPGEPLLYENSLGLLELAVNQGSAAEMFGLTVGDPLGGCPRIESLLRKS